MFEPTGTYAPATTRYDTMPYNRCGTSGLKLPAVSLGFWHNFGDITPVRPDEGPGASPHSTTASPTSTWPTTTAPNPAAPRRTAAG